MIESSFGYLTSCALATSPSQNNYIYFSYSDSSKNIYAYINNGSAWQPVAGALLPESGTVSRVAYDTQGNLYVGITNNNSPSSIYTSSNGVWTKVANSPLPNNAAIANMVVANNILYVAANVNESGYVYTPLNNNQWESVGGIITNNDAIYSMTSNQTGTLFVGTAHGNLYQFVNNTWQSINVPLSSAIEALAIGPDNNLYLANGAGYAYEYLNNTWLQLGGESIPDDIFMLSVSNEGKVVVGNKDGNVYQIVNGLWQALVTGAATNSPIITTFVDGATGVVYIGGVESSDSNNYVYAWNNNTWNIVNNTPLPNSQLVRMFAKESSGNLYAATFILNGESGANIYESKNGQWSLVNNQSLPYAGIVSSMVVKNNQIYVAYSIDSGGYIGVVFESVAGVWTIVNNAPVSLSGIGPIVLDHKNNLFAAAGGILNVILESSSAVFESVNGSWVAINQPLPVQEHIMAMNVDNNNHLYIGSFNNFSLDNSGYLSSGNVYESANGSWQLVNGPLPSYAGGVVSIQFDKKNNLYVGTFLGNVYISQHGMWVLSNSYYTIATSMALIYN